VTATGHDEELVEVAKVTITDLVALVDELNTYTEQLKALLEEAEG